MADTLNNPDFPVAPVATAPEEGLEDIHLPAEEPETEDDDKPRPIHKKLTETKQEEIITQCLAQIVEIEGDREGKGKFNDNLAKWTRQYLNIVPEKNTPWKDCSNFHAPITTIDIDTHTSRLLNVNIGTKPYVRVLPVGKEDIKQAQNSEQLLNWQFDEEIKIPSLLYDVFFNALLYPACVTEVAWKKVTRKITKKVTKEVPEYSLDPYTGDPVKINSNTVETEEETTEDVLNQPIVSIINLKDFLFYANAQDIQFDDLCIRHWWMKDDLVRMEAEGDIANVKELSEFDAGRIMEYDDEVKDTYEGVEATKPEQRKEKEIFKVWKYIDLDGDGIPEDWLFLIARHDKKMLYGNPNPFKHGKRNVVIHRAHRLPGEIFGISRAARQRPINNMINSSFNMSMDNSALSVNKISASTGASGFDPTKQKRRPGAHLTIEGGRDEFWFMETTDINPSMMALNGNLVDWWRQLTNVTETVQGQFPEGVERPSAKGTGLLLQQADSSFETLNLLLQESLSEMYHQILQLDQQYLPDEKAMRIIGSDGEIDFLTLSRRDIQGRYDVRPQGNSVVSNKAQERRDMLHLQELYRDDPLINQVNLRKRVFGTFDVKNTGDLLSENADAIQQMAEQAALGQLAPSDSGGNGQSPDIQPS